MCQGEKPGKLPISSQPRRSALQAPLPRMTGQCMGQPWLTPAAADSTLFAVERLALLLACAPASAQVTLEDGGRCSQADSGLFPPHSLCPEVLRLLLLETTPDHRFTCTVSAGSFSAKPP